MDKSLIVQGKSLEEALNKAAGLLCCSREAVAYEILREPKPSRYGQPSIPCKLRVMSVDFSAEAEQADPKAMSLPELPLPWSLTELEALDSAKFLQALHSISMPEETPPLSAPIQTQEDIGGNLGPGNSELFSEGNLRICGSVLKGASVQATGSVHVGGNVETARIEAGGDIVVEGGVLGRLRSQRGSISCVFSQGALLEAPLGDIRIAESAMHTQMRAGGAARIGDILLGGTCYGAALVETRIAGSESGVPTVIIAGQNKKLREEAEVIRQEALEIHRNLLDCRKDFQQLQPQEERAGPLPVAGRILLWQTAARMTQCEHALWQLSRKKTLVLGMINADKGARICVRERAHAKVKILVDDAPLEISALTQFVSFSKDYETGEVRVTSYQ